MRNWQPWTKTETGWRRAKSGEESQLNIARLGIATVKNIDEIPAAIRKADYDFTLEASFGNKEYSILWLSGDYYWALEEFTAIDKKGLGADHPFCRIGADGIMADTYYSGYLVRAMPDDDKDRARFTVYDFYV